MTGGVAGFLAELRRRNVVRVAALYLVAAWLVVQVAETLLPIFDTPGWVLKTLVVLLALGFVPALAVAWAFELTPEGLKRERDVARDTSTVDPTARKLDVAVIVLLLAVGALMLWQGARGPGAAPDAATAAVAGEQTRAADATATETGAGTADATAMPDASIAVLAFADMSPAGDSEFLGDGIAEEILNALAKVDGLKVAGRTSSFSFKGKDEDLRAIGQALGVAHVLEGSVRRQGDQVRVTAQLIRTADGFHLWSETYPGTLADVFALQEDIARAVAGELQVKLGVGAGEKLVDAGTTDAEAYALYLQASMIFHRRQGPRMPEAEQMLLKAIELDPTYAKAWARIASLRAIARNYRIVDQREALAGVLEAAERATALDPTLAEPYAAMGTQFGAIREFDREMAAFARALELEPDDVIANVWQGTALATGGYREAAHAQLDRALALDPLLPIALLWRGTAHVTQGDPEIGERQLRLADEGGLAFAGLGLGQLAASRGDVDGAAAQFTRAFTALAADFAPDDIALFSRACAADPAARAPAIARIDAWLARDPDPVPAILVYTLLSLGEHERALPIFAKAPSSNDALVLGSFFRGVFPGARTSPAFPAFARDTGLAALWDAEGPPDGCAKRGDDWICEP